MNNSLLQDGLVEQQENWFPDTFIVTEEQEGGNVEKQHDAQGEETEGFCNASSSGGSETSAAGPNGTRPPGLQSDGSSEGNPGEQRCSRGHRCSDSEQLYCSQNNEKVSRVIQEMKQFLPVENRDGSSKASALSVLSYALKCIQQIQSASKTSQVFGEQRSSQTSHRAFSIEELEAVASEHAPKNTDTFVAVFSLLSGQTVHVSEQAASILNCKKKLLESSRFAELLAPQDVGTFFVHTSQSHLPLWNVEAETESLYEYAQVKSFFCRLKGGRNQNQERRCYPFRITPYLVNVCSSDHNEPTSCCLTLAEKIHSGYEAPRIPLEKRIFTTTHSPGCFFLEVDDRAVPLLGYLPQDLIGTSILMYLHPEDRPVMAAIHRKVLKFAGHSPFEHSPIRFCTQNGDYVILDTSWSSFVNPWSRKVSFIIGRHKVRTSPLNEDVFAPRSREVKKIDKEIWELQGEIYRLLLQPVHSNGSSGYGSLVSNGSYEHYISVASSSDSNGNCVEELQRELVTLRQVCVDVSRLKHVGQQLYIESHSKSLHRRDGGAGRAKGKNCVASRAPHTAVGRNAGGQPAASSDDLQSAHHILSYQQINCMDSILRYLESCNIPVLKRRCESSANTSTSSSEDDRQAHVRQPKDQILEDASGFCSFTSQSPAVSRVEEIVEPRTAAAVVGPPVTDLDLGLTTKALSVVSVTSQCSYSSTLVHFPHPESEATMLEEATVPSEQAELSPSNTPSAAAAALEEIKLVGLTKEALSAHTQKEEQNYVDQFRRRILLSPYRSRLWPQRAGSNGAASPDQGARSRPTSPVSWRINHQERKCRCPKPEASLCSNWCKMNGDGEAPAAAWPHPGLSRMTLPLPPSLVLGFSVTPSGGSPALGPLGVAPGIPPYLPCSIQPISAFPAPYLDGSFMAGLFQSSPACPPPPASFCLTQAPCSPVPPGPPSTLLPAPVPDFTARTSSPTAHPSAEEQCKASGDQSPLFGNSRSSSPLQLNLLQEESPKAPEPFSQAPGDKREAVKHDEDGEEAGNTGNRSTPRELPGPVLEDPELAAGGSRQVGAGSKYFASCDSSEVSEDRKRSHAEEGEGRAPPARMKEEVLKKDLEKLAAMQMQQPWFTEEQKEELAEVHPWIRTQSLPQAIDTQGCSLCDGQKESWEAAVPGERPPPGEDDEDLLFLCDSLPPQKPP
uniref:Period circadian regulator 3 n=1 Tax=Salvator merianae TaxID=96440 RepID=A0A8D0DW97_SALMN